MANYFQQVTDPTNIPIRPLSKGMIRNLSSQTLPVGAMHDIKNYIVDETGLTRRPGFTPYGPGVATYDNIVKVPYNYIDLFTFWTTSAGDLAQQLLLITDGLLYQVGLGGFQEILWAYSTGTVTIAGSSVTGVGTAWADEEIYPGDIVRAGLGEARIGEINANLNITLSGEFPNTIGDLPAGSSYQIVRSFNTDSEHLCDYAVVGNEVVFADFNKPLVAYKYDEVAGAQMELFIQDDAHKIDSGSGPEDFIAGTIAFFKNRLFAGNTLEGTDGLRRHRIRWSKVTNPRDFSDTWAWLDLPYTQGRLRRLVPMGGLLVAYFDDAIFLGTPTNNPKLPVAFQQLDTGSIGLVSSKAVVSFTGGNFFVGQDDVYFLSGRGPERVGSPIISESIRKCAYRERIYAAIDPENDRVVFGMPRSSNYIERLWSFQYKSKGWSWDSVLTTMVANPLQNLSLTWEDLAGFTWDGAGGLGDTYTTWDDMQASGSERSLFVEHSGYLWRLGKTTKVDKEYDDEGLLVDVPIEAVFETGDFDFNEPDTVKTFIRASLKVDFDTMPAIAFLFAVQGSWNRGRNQAALGSAVMEVNYDESYVNYLITSSHVRLKFTTTAAVAPFTVVEIVLKVRKRGSENTTGMQTP